MEGQGGEITLSPLAGAMLGAIGALIVAAAIIFFVVQLFGLTQLLLLCRRCGLRIATVKLSHVHSQYQAERLGEELFWAGKKVCAECYDHLRTMDFPKDGLWSIGGIVDYVKNAPAFVAVVTSVASLVIAILALVSK